MKSILYILAATALVTIVPFLATFENGQDIVRGLFEYGIFAILLFYLAIKKILSIRFKWVLQLATYLSLVTIAWIDLLTILFYKNQSVGLLAIIPLITSLVAIFFLKDQKGISFRNVSLILFISLFLHFGATRFLPSQPIFQFSIPLFLAQSQPYVDRSHLPDVFRTHLNTTDSVTITKNYLDATHDNVVILVESWGIPMDSAKFNEELAVFEGTLKKQGAHFRMYSRTRTAEREDLLDSAWRDSTRHRDSLFMPKRFAELGYTTTFLFGGDSTIQWRHKYIRNIGFQNAIWTDSATADIVMAAKIDSLLSLTDSTTHFIAWTTRDTRFPISDDPIETEKLYYERLFGTLKIVADLAKKHPDARFVVQGDHEPILSPLEFQAKFYRRWVPYVILN